MDGKYFFQFFRGEPRTKYWYRFEPRTLGVDKGCYVECPPCSIVWIVTSLACHLDPLDERMREISRREVATTPQSCRRDNLR